MVKKKGKFKRRLFGVALLGGAGASLAVLPLNPGLGLSLGATVGTISVLDTLLSSPKSKKKKR